MRKALSDTVSVTGAEPLFDIEAELHADSVLNEPVTGAVADGEREKANDALPAPEDVGTPGVGVCGTDAAATMVAPAARALVVGKVLDVAVMAPDNVGEPGVAASADAEAACGVGEGGADAAAAADAPDPNALSEGASTVAVGESIVDSDGDPNADAVCVAARLEVPGPDSDCDRPGDALALGGCVAPPDIDRIVAGVIDAH